LLAVLSFNPNMPRARSARGAGFGTPKEKICGPKTNSRFRWKHPCIEQKHRQRNSGAWLSLCAQLPAEPLSEWPASHSGFEIRSGVCGVCGGVRVRVRRRVAPPRPAETHGNTGNRLTHVCSSQRGGRCLFRFRVPCPPPPPPGDPVKWQQLPRRLQVAAGCRLLAPLHQHLCVCGCRVCAELARGVLRCLACRSGSIYMSQKWKQAKWAGHFHFDPFPRPNRPGLPRIPSQLCSHSAP
jgi:hypothetical protein